MLNRLLDGFNGILTKSSSDTALRDIQYLIKKGILRKEKEGGISTNYEIIDFNK